MQRVSRALIFLLIVAAAYAATRARHELVDFGVYRTAALRALHAEPLYRSDDGHWQFKYLPAFAVVMAPFAWIGDEPARAVWFALNAGLLVWFYRQSAAAVPDRRHTARFLIAIAAILGVKFWVKELVLGQTNVMLGVLALAALAAVRRGRPYLAGALIGAAIFVKPYAIVLLPWLALAAGPASLIPTIIVAAFGLLLPALRYGWHGNADLLMAWYRTVTDTTTPNLQYPENVSIAAMWAKWLGIGTGASTLTAVTSVVAFGAGLSTMIGRRRTPQPAFLECAALMLLTPLLSPQGWDYVLILGIPAIMCLVDRWEDDPVWLRVLLVLCLAAISVTIFDVLGRATYERLMAWSIQTVAGLGLLASLIMLRRRALA